MPQDRKWSEITDLPPDICRLTNDELRPLQRVWQQQKDGLAVASALEEFNGRLKREWAVETGSIEGVYTVDRGVTQMLIEHGIKASLIPHQANNKTPEHVAMVMMDHADVLEGLFDFVKGTRGLTVGYIKELHAALLHHEDTVVVSTPDGKLFEKKLEKGVYKKMPNNPRREDGTVYEYCPPEHVSSEMDRLVAMQAEHSARAVPPEVEAAWLHHRFTQIHPFEDGNGRVARALATLIFIKAGWFPLVVRTIEKAAYIGALEAADESDLGQLVVQFASIQKRILFAAINLSPDVTLPETVDNAVSATRDLLVGAGRSIPPEWEKARSVTAGELYRHAVERLEYTANKLTADITSARHDYRFSTSTAEWNEFALRVAKQLGYTANFQTYLKSVDLRLLPGNAPWSSLAVSFHGIGNAYRGIVVVSIFLFTAGQDAVPVCDEPFQINYEEELEQARKRFDPWLEKSIIRGIALWQQSAG